MSTDTENSIVPTQGHREHRGTGPIRSVSNSTDPSHHRWHAEVHQQSKTQVRDFQVGQELTFKDRIQRASRFDFYNDSVVNDQIGPTCFREGRPLELEADRLLTYDLKTEADEVTRQHNLIDGFEKSRSQLLVYAHASRDNGTGNSIQVIQPCASVLSEPRCKNDVVNGCMRGWGVGMAERAVIVTNVPNGIGPTQGHSEHRGIGLIRSTGNSADASHPVVDDQIRPKCFLEGRSLEFRSSNPVSLCSLCLCVKTMLFAFNR